MEVTEVIELLSVILKELRSLKEEVYNLRMEIKNNINLQQASDINKAIIDLGEQIQKLPKIIMSNVLKNVLPMNKTVVIYPFADSNKEKKRRIIAFLDDLENELVGKESRKRSFNNVWDSHITDLEEIDPSEIANALEVLSNPDRLKILKYLYTRARYFSEFEELLDMGPSSLRHHLSKLMSAGLIKQERSRGKYLITNKGIVALILLFYLYKKVFEGEYDG